MDDFLPFGYALDRDYFIDFARIFGLIRCTFDVLVLHPLVIFVVLRKSATITMDCKVGYVCHTLVMIGFEINNGILYQMYTLLPLPILMCSGLLCNGADVFLQTILSFWTVAVCVPYLFLIIRMHQRMLFTTSSPLKVSNSIQALLLLAVTSLLFSNVFGFRRWTVDIPNKSILINSKEVSWAKNFSSNFLVFGQQVGEIGLF
ncbi:hypothetical protein PMAYCL1PPCAC_16494, partial [Pristionchus mayeri]